MTYNALTRHAKTRDGVPADIVVMMNRGTTADDYVEIALERLKDGQGYTLWVCLPVTDEGWHGMDKGLRDALVAEAWREFTSLEDGLLWIAGLAEECDLSEEGAEERWFAYAHDEWAGFQARYPELARKFALGG